MFARLPDATDRRAVVDVVVDGMPVAARAGDTAAAAMLVAGVTHCRATPLSGAPRAPFCMMGVCFDCLVMIDDVHDRQACLVVVAPGMRIDTPRGTRVADRVVASVDGRT